MSIFNKPQQKPMPTFSTSQTVLPSAAISRIESGSLAELNVPNLMLKKGEKCCFVDKSYEMVETTTTRNIRKSGGTSMPSVFFKGVRYHMGSSESVPVTETKVDYIPGYLYITKTYYFHLTERRLRKVHWFSFRIPSLFQRNRVSIWTKGHKLYSASCGSGSTDTSNYDVNHRKGIAIWEI